MSDSGQHNRSQSKPRGHRRLPPTAFSLIELIIAMLAATVLLASLAGTVVISTNLLEVPPSDESLWHDRTIADRLNSDLRYATSIDTNYSNGIQITKPDPITAVPVTVTYEAYMDGLTRQVDSDPVMNLDPEAPGEVHSVDGYSAPTYIAPNHKARVISSSNAATTAATSFLDINIPDGCRDGDLVLCCLSAKTPDSLSISESGWQVLQSNSVSNLRILVVYRVYDSSWPPTLRISSTPDSAMAAVMVVVENVDPTSPVDWTSSSSGLSFENLSWTHPSYQQSSTPDDRQLNIQIFASEGSPWSQGAMGMASFCDVTQATAAAIDIMRHNSIGVVVRNGGAPSLSFTPRLLHPKTGYWLRASAHLEVAP